MVAERVEQRGLVMRGVGLVRHASQQREYRALRYSGDVISDIYKFSGLSDQEIAQALGVTLPGLLNLSARRTGASVARDFLRINMRLADRMPLAEVTKWWRTGENQTRLDIWVYNLSFRK